MAIRRTIELGGQEALAWLAAGAVALDVRERGERDAVRMPDSLWIPITELARRWPELPGSLPVLVYCSAGSRSYRAAKFLRERGLESAALVGGINEWISKGGAVEAGPRELAPTN